MRSLRHSRLASSAGPKSGSARLVPSRACHRANCSAPSALVTGKAVFRFDAAAARFTLDSLHPGETAESIRAATGFDYDAPATPAVTADPTAAELALLRGPVCDEMLETYPDFCARVFARKAAA